ncbi:hypothetical protein [Methylococcus capsulatus]|uniref:hypothetical protein n=1 Tax=Methylococcus capsulatus TaxID=414 RepID=UPI00059CE91F|nr:hypothetical protein [Methylococcus capsulatus]QXP94441.1 hypothetical protein KW113_04380 [Methylococcus capsulatus]UQN13596.1 hypothetical protein M3M30_07075 [Methylococcus capsulatus]
MPIRIDGEYPRRRPMTPAGEQNPVQVEQSLDDACPSIGGRAKAAGAVMHRGDGTAVLARGLSMVSATSNQGLVRFECTESSTA